MYIYADESGHTGKCIFNEPPFYFQGAILSVVDTEPLICPVVDRYKERLSVDRLHANELHQAIVEEIALALLDTLAATGWLFHVTVIEKQYLSVTKFVDSIFDSGENKGMRWLWYNHEFFRHTLCCLVDHILPTRMKQAFWEAYLADDYQGISSVVTFALDQLDNSYVDPRLKEVTRDGLTFALAHPQEITLMASEKKESYKGHTPNMVAFISLLQAVHKFSRENNVVPKTFVHDQQCEFNKTMREYHTLNSHVRPGENRLGFPQEPERVECGLGEFTLRSSKDVASLQAIDILLWLSQRTDRIGREELKKRLGDRIDPFYISRAMSEMIVSTWQMRLATVELTQDQIARAERLLDDLEQSHLKRLNE